MSLFATTYANYDKYRVFWIDDDDDESIDGSLSEANESDECCDNDSDGTASEAHESDEELDYDSDDYISDDELSEAEIERMRVRDSNSDAPAFDEAFPNDQSIEILDGKDFVVRVAKSRIGSYVAEWLEESDSVTGIINRAMYAFLVAKLTER